MSELRRYAAAAACALFLAGNAAAGDAADMGDPTRPSRVVEPSPRKAAAPAPSWRVASIIVSPERRLAVINGRLVGVNDRVNEARIVEILPYEVRLEYRGEIRRISLVPTRVKHPANR